MVSRQPVMVTGTWLTTSVVAVDSAATALVVGSRATVLAFDSPALEAAATAGGREGTASAGDLVVVTTGAGFGFSTAVLGT
jgi:hypothetical protein